MSQRILQVCRAIPAAKWRACVALCLLAATGGGQWAWAQPTIVDVRMGSVGPYQVGADVTMVAVFSEAVHVREDEVRGTQVGQLRMVISVGANNREAQYCRGSGTGALIFCYRVQTGDTAPGGISIGPNALEGGLIEDATGTHAANRDHAAVPPSADQEVDGNPPVIYSARIASTPASAPANPTYGAGEVITVELEFRECRAATCPTERVNVTGNPQIFLNIGGNRRAANYHDGSGSPRLTFRYTVRNDDIDNDGISIGPGTDSNGAPRSFSGGTIEDQIGNPARRDFRGLPADRDHRVNGGIDVDAPAIVAGGVAVTSPIGNYGTGEIIEITATFDEIVFVTGAPTLALRIGATDRLATYADGSGSAALIFRYEVRAGEQDEDGISIGADALTRPGGATIRDRAGNVATLAFAAPGRQPLHRVQATAPFVRRVAFSNTPLRGNTYRAGETITAVVEFDCATCGGAASNTDFEVTGNPTLELTLHSSSRTARLMRFRSVRGGALTFEYTVSAGDWANDGVSIPAGPGALVGGVIRDMERNVADRSFDALPRDPTRRVASRIDAAGPRIQALAISSLPASGDTYRAGEWVTVTVSFDEPVYLDAFLRPRLILNFGGAPGACSSPFGPPLPSTCRTTEYLAGNGTSQLVFRRLVRASEDRDGISVDANSLDINGGTLGDSSGNAGVLIHEALPTNARHKVDGIPPRPNNTPQFSSTPASGNTYIAGETITVELPFSEAVNVRGTPTIGLTIDSRRRQAVYNGRFDPNTNALGFDYTVGAGERDANGVSIVANSLAGNITDAAGNPADLRHAARPDDSNHQVDGGTDNVPPALQSVQARTSGPAPRFNVLGLGERLDLAVTFTEAVFIQGAPTLTLRIGGRDRSANYASGDGTNTLVFRYVVGPADDGDVVLSGFDFAGPNDIADAAGNSPATTINRDPEEIEVDGIVPRALGFDVRSSAGLDNTYKRGESIEVALRLSEEACVAHDPDIGLDIRIGARTRRARLTSDVTSCETRELLFSYEVQQGDQAPNGVQIAANAVRGGTITDRARNPADLRGVALSAQPRHQVDGVAAGATVEIVSDPGEDQTYSENDNIEVRVTFDHANVESLATGSGLVLTIGDRRRVAALQRSRPTQAFYAYRVQPGDVDANGITIRADALRGGGFTNPNVAPIINAAGHRVDAVAPQIAELAIVSNPDNGDTYERGEEIEVDITFSELVWVDANPRLRLDIGTRKPAALYRSGGGTRTLRFVYAVQPGDNDDDGIAVSAGALIEGVIRDAANNNVVRLLQPLEAQPNHKVSAGEDTLAPYIIDGGVRITSRPLVDQTYAIGETVQVQVVFSEAVNVLEVALVDGSTIELERPVLELVLRCDGDVSRSARLAPEDDASDTLTFNYVLVEGDCAADGISIPQDALSGGQIVDYSGRNNAATRSHDAVPADPDQRVDAVRPQAADLPRIQPGPRSDGPPYELGEVFRVLVPFTERVYVNGEPVLRLDIGGAQREARLITGSGTRTLEFQYTVRVGDQDDDGVSIGPDSINGGTVRDHVGNEWLPRRLAALLADGRNVVNGGSDNLQPVVTGVAFASRPREGTAFRSNEAIDVQVCFNEPVYVTGQPVIGISIGAETRQAAYHTGSGEGGDDATPSCAGSLTFRYRVVRDDYDPDGISISPNALAGGTIQDSAGNQAVRDFAGVPQDANRRVNPLRDSDPPTVRRVEVVSRGTYGIDDEVVVRVTFSEAVFVNGAPAVELSIGANTRQAAYSDGAGTERLTFRYTVQAGDEDSDGLTINADALVGGRVTDASGNEVVRAFSAPGRLTPHRVDARRPAATRVLIRSNPRRPAGYGLGEIIRLRVVFDEPVWVTADASGPSLNLALGRETVAADFVDGSGTTNLDFRYVVRIGDFAPNGIALSPDALRGGIVEDRAGNNWGLEERRIPELPAQRDHRVISGTNYNPPIIERVAITSQPERLRTYRSGETIEVEMRFSEIVHVRAPPRLTLSIDSASRDARYATGSGSRVLVFRYTVRIGDLDTDGISISPGPATLAGGEIVDEENDQALRDFRAVRPDDRHLVDAVPPRVTAPPTIVSTPAAGDTYRAGEHIDVRVTFNEDVVVSDNPKLRLRIGVANREAAYDRDATTARTLAFRYTVRENDLDTDGVSIAGDALTGGMLTDAVGNASERELPPLEDQSDHKVDGVPPAATTVTITSNPANGDTYRAGEVITVEVTFNETIRVPGADNCVVSQPDTVPKLALTIGRANPQATLACARETTLVFNYTVRYGDLDADGVSVEGEALIGGTATDRAGNPLARVVDLDDQPEHKVDTSATVELSQINLTVGGGSVDIDLSAIIDYAGLYNEPTSSDPNVAIARVSGHRLTIEPVAEGRAVVSVTARAEAVITLNVPVVVSASAAEVAVLKQALAAVGRNILASAAQTIGARLELGARPRAMSLVVGGRRLDSLGPGGTVDAPITGRPAFVGAHASQPGHPVHLARHHDGAQPGMNAWAGAANGGDRGPAVARPGRGNGALVNGALVNASSHPWASQLGLDGRSRWQDTSFELPLLGGNGRSDWSMWGGGDYATFEGEPGDSRFEGAMSAMYLGMDGRGPGWVAGGAVGRVAAETTYQFKEEGRPCGDGQATPNCPAGRVDTTMTTFQPYVGWSFTERAKAWVVFGFGSGEALMQRKNPNDLTAPSDQTPPYAAETSDLSMRMGLIGGRANIGEPGGFDVAIRADAGAINLETGDGDKAIDALAVRSERVRVGVEMSYSADTGGNLRLAGGRGGGSQFSPFLEVAGRLDRGDGPTGAGAEVAAGVRYQSSTVSFEAKARTLAIDGEEKYKETGASAAFVMRPKGNKGRGWRLAVAPSYGGASDATDVFFRRDYAAQVARGHSRDSAYDEWRVNARVEYGMPLRGRSEGGVAPFVAADVSSGVNRRARVGFSFDTKTAGGAPVRLEVSGERARTTRGNDHRVLVSAEGHF